MYVQSNPPEPLKFEIKNGLIKIGGRTFFARVGETRVTDEDVLKKHVHIFAKYFGEEAIARAMHEYESRAESATHTITASPGPMKISLSTEKGTLKISSSVRQEPTELQASKEGLQESVSKLTTHAQQASKTRKELEAQFKKAGYSTEVVRQAIDNVLNESHTSLASIVEGKAFENPLGIEKTLSDVLHEPGNEGLRSAVHALASSYKQEKTTSYFARFRPKKEKSLKKCEQELRIAIMERMRRNPKVLPGMIQSFSRGKYDLPDTSCTIRADEFRDANAGIPSAADHGKHRTDEISRHNVNMGSVKMQQEQGTVIVVNRSGRSDNKERMKEVVVDALINQLSCDNPKGIRETNEDDEQGNPVYEFQHQITSHCDLSWVKGLVAKDDESKTMMEIFRAANSWPKDGYRVIIDGRTYVIKKPIIRNQIMSSVAKGIFPERTVAGVDVAKIGTGKTASDRMNFMPNQQLLQLYLSVIPESQELKAAREALLARLGKETDFDHIDYSDMVKKSSFFESSEFKDYQKAVATFLLQQAVKGDIRALALYSVMFRRNLPEGGAERALLDIETYSQWPTTQDEMHVADVELYANVLNETLQLSTGKQCKSGKDRTAISVALKVAQARFRQQYKDHFIPTETDPAKIDQFKEYFIEALIKFGLEVTVESAGISGLKLGMGSDNPVYYKYMPDRYVTGATSRKYSRQLSRKTMVYGKSKKSTQERVVEARAAITDVGHLAQLATKVRDDTEAFLLDSLGLQQEFTKGTLLSDALELKPHIRQLKLGQNDRLELLQEEIERLKEEPDSEERNLKLYVLKRIEGLWLERQDLKNMPSELSMQETGGL